MIGVHDERGGTRLPDTGPGSAAAQLDRYRSGRLAKLRVEAFELAAEAQTSADTYPAIARSIDQLHDPHTKFFAPAAARELFDHAHHAGRGTAPPRNPPRSRPPQPNGLPAHPPAVPDPSAYPFIHGSVSRPASSIKVIRYPIAHVRTYRVH
jgi:hypothetical protein